jgi:hypothetical protein
MLMNNSSKLFMNEWKIYLPSIVKYILLLTYQSGCHEIYNNARVMVYLTVNWALWGVSYYVCEAKQCSLNLENLVDIEEEKRT